MANPQGISLGTVSALVAICTAAATFLSGLLTGGFNIGSEVTEINAEIKLLRSEAKNQNEMLVYRIDKLERKISIDDSTSVSQAPLLK